MNFRNVIMALVAAIAMVGCGPELINPENQNKQYSQDQVEQGEQVNLGQDAAEGAAEGNQANGDAAAIDPAQAAILKKALADLDLVYGAAGAAADSGIEITALVEGGYEIDVVFLGEIERLALRNLRDEIHFWLLGHGGDVHTGQLSGNYLDALRDIETSLTELKSAVEAELGEIIL